MTNLHSMAATGNTLRKQERLKSRKVIQELFRSGRQFSHFPFRVTCQFASSQDPLQVGVAVSSRQFKKAVHRNRIKRLIREAWRLNKSELKTELSGRGIGMQLFIIYTGNELPEFQHIQAKLLTLIQRLIKMTHEMDQPPA